MTRRSEESQAIGDIDVATLGRALWRAKGWILGLAIGAGVVTFIALSMMRPLFTSEARILIQNDESTFTRPASEQGFDPSRGALDEQALQSQVQVLTSRDLALQVIKGLDLTNNPNFAKDAGVGLVGRLLGRFGIGKGSQESEEEKAANTFARHLNVYQLGRSSVIAVEYTSGYSPLAAEAANKLSDVYIEWQREAKLDQTKDATLWLRTQIDVLRKRVAESEEAVERFRAEQGLFAGSNNVTLNAQQLSELNSQLILAKAQSSEAQARAHFIKEMLAKSGDIDATTEVLKSDLITRLIEQRVTVQRQLAELSATLLPSHPRIRQLAAELADVRKQTRDEVEKIVQGLENEAQVAAARESSLRASLNEVKEQTSGISEAEIQLRALEREAKANRELLESYLTRYRDASAHHDMGAVPAQAAIISRAHASLLPSFPKKLPITALVSFATALLALTYVLARELIGAPTRAPAPLAEPAPISARSMRERRRGPRDTLPPEPLRRAADVAPAPLKSRGEPASLQAAAAPAARAATMPVPFEMPSQADAPRGADDAPPAERPSASAQPLQANEPITVNVEPPPDEEGAPAKKNASWLSWSKAPANGKDEKGEKRGEPVMTDAEFLPTPPMPVTSGPSAGELPAAAGLLDRLRKGLDSGPREMSEAKAAPSPGLFGRLRQSLPGGKAVSAAAESAASHAPTGAPLRPNDLRHYLNERLAAATAEAGKDAADKAAKAPKGANGKTSPVLKSLDAVLNHVLTSGKGIAPRALLVAGAAPGVDPTQEAIQIARAFVARHEQVMLVDLTRGAAAVSGRLGIPRAPGFTDLAAGRASFEDVVRVDADTPLQVIAAGNPAIKSDGEETDAFMRVFEALTQVYDCVVLHADREVIRKLRPALKFELPASVAVLPAGTTAKGVDSVDLTEFSSLGCPVVVYEQSGKEPRSGLFGRLAAATS